MAKFPVGTAADIGDSVPADYWQNLGEIANTYYFNVKQPDFGAAGNNSADDTAEIQACIDASAPGDTILFPPGTYLISSPIILKPNRSYWGWGPAWADQTVIKVANGSSSNFQSTSTHSGVLVSEAWNNNATVAAGPVDIRNLSLDGNKANNTSGQHSGLLLYGEYWSLIDNLRCYNNKKSGVLLQKTAKGGSAQVTGISDLEFHNLHCAANDGDGLTQLSPSGAANNTDIILTGHCLFYDNGGAGIIADNPGGWWLNNVHMWNNQTHGVYFDTGSWGVKINGLYIESFGIAAAASTQYFGLRLRTFDAGVATKTVPVQIENVTVQTTDPAGTASFYCVSVVGDGTDAHAYLANVHALGANTARGHGIELWAQSGTFTIHDTGTGVSGFTAGQGREYGGAGTRAYDPPRVMAGTASWTPGAIGANAGATTSVTVTGASLGDRVAMGYNQNLQDGLILTGEVSAADTVTAQIRNVTAGSITPTAGTVNATVWKH